MTLYFYYATCILREAAAAGAGSQGRAEASGRRGTHAPQPRVPAKGRPRSAASTWSREPAAWATGAADWGLEFPVPFHLVPSQGSRKPASGKKMYPKTKQNKTKTHAPKPKPKPSVILTSKRTTHCR